MPTVQLRSRELTSIHADFANQAIDRVALIQAHSDSYLFGARVCPLRTALLMSRDTAVHIALGRPTPVLSGPQQNIR